MWAVLFVVGIERYQVQGTGMMLRVNRFLFLPEHSWSVLENFLFHPSRFNGTLQAGPREPPGLSSTRVRET